MSAHTFNCVCHCMKSMFRVLGVYNFAWDPGHIYLNQNAKVSTCASWIGIHVTIKEKHISFYPNFLYLLLITKLYSILISRWIFEAKY